MTNRFSSLKVLRQERQESELNEPDIVNPATTRINEVSPNIGSTINPLLENTESTSKRPVGRPPGRRSNPDYTQISAYIPIEILQEVQDVLAQERRISKQRTPRPVSDLVEELLSEWLKLQKSKNSAM